MGRGFLRESLSGSVTGEEGLWKVLCLGIGASVKASLFPGAPWSTWPRRGRGRGSLCVCVQGGVSVGVQGQPVEEEEEEEEAKPPYRAVRAVADGLTHTKAHRCEPCESASQ